MEGIYVFQRPSADLFDPAQCGAFLRRFYGDFRHVVRAIDLSPSLLVSEFLTGCVPLQWKCELLSCLGNKSRPSEALVVDRYRGSSHGHPRWTHELEASLPDTP